MSKFGPCLLFDTQAEGPCGWLTDKSGVSWQMVPTALLEMLGSADSAAASLASAAMMGFMKLDIAALRRAYEDT